MAIVLASAYYDGLIFRCTAQDFTEENCIGILMEEGCIEKQSERSPNLIEKAPYGKCCMNCRILPICPVCYRRRKEQHYMRCPIDIDDKKALMNIKMAFSSLSGIEIDI